MTQRGQLQSLRRKSYSIHSDLSSTQKSRAVDWTIFIAATVGAGVLNAIAGGGTLLIFHVEREQH